MFGRLKKIVKKSRIVLAIDIGSGSIRSAVAEVNSSGKIKILRVYRYPLHMVSDIRINEERIRARIKTVLRELVTEVSKTNGQPDRIEVSLAPTFFVGKTGTIVAKRDARLKVSYDELQNLLVRESKNLSQSFSETHAHASPIEYSVMESSVNGYHIDSPIDFYCDELSLSVRFSFTSAAFKKLLDEVFLRSWHAPNVHIRSSPVTLFSLMKLVYPARKQYVVFDIGAEVSQLIFVKDGSIVSTQILTQGGNSFARRIAAHTGMTVDDAVSLVKILSDGLKGEEYYGARRAFEGAVQDFQKELGGALEKNPQFLSSPYVFMVGGGANSALLIRDSKHSFGKFFKAPPSFYVLRPEAFKEYFVFPFGLRGSEDIELIALLLHE